MSTSQTLQSSQELNHQSKEFFSIILVLKFQEPGYLIHAPHNLLELGGAIHECTATTLWDTETLVNSKTHTHSL